MGLILWLLVSLISISFVGNYPVLSLSIAILGGTGIGLYLFSLSSIVHRPSSPSPSSVVRRPWSVFYRLLSIVHRPSSIVAFPFILILLFSKRLPPTISLVSVAMLLCFWCYQRWKRFSMPTPLDISILILLLLPATVGLYASPDPQLTSGDVFSLVAAVAFFYVIINQSHKFNVMKISENQPLPEAERGEGCATINAESISYTPPSSQEEPVLSLPKEGRGVGLDHGEALIFTPLSHKFTTVVLWVIIVGAVGALGLLFVMQAPPVKFPVLGRIFLELPNILPRKIHPNYAGGVLVLFLPLSVWGSVFYKKKSLWITSGAIALGLLLTQSRGAILGASMAMILTLCVQLRWIRWVFLLFIVGGGIVLYSFGGSFILDPVGSGDVQGTWEGRKELYQRAIYIIQDFSFTGIGMHSFPVVVDLLYPLFLAGPDARVPHAHNFFLQIAVDMGIPGFVAFWMLLGVWGGVVWELVKKTAPGLPGSAFRPLVLGLTGGMIAHLIYGLTDAIALGEKAGIFFWINLGLTVSLWRLVRVGEGSQSHE